jgi:DNA-binding response OmpR family regulator
MAKILVVEDDNHINDLLTELLVRERYDIKQAYSGTEAWRMLREETFDLMILDLMLPGMTGEELISKLRGVSDLPVIVITAKADIQTLVDVLSLGADDYIAKPFQPKEVLARVNACLRRRIPSQQSEILRAGALVLNPEDFTAKWNDTPLRLTQKEFEMLSLFVRNPKKVFTKANIYESVWQDTYYGDDNTITVHVSRMRSKLAEVTDEEIVETVWGVGFKLASAFAEKV